MNDQAPLCLPLGLCPPPYSSPVLLSTVLKGFTLHFVLPKDKRTKPQDFPLWRLTPSGLQWGSAPRCGRRRSWRSGRRSRWPGVCRSNPSVHRAAGRAGGLGSARCAHPADWPPTAQHSHPSPTQHGQKNPFQQSPHPTKAICFPSCFFNHYTNITQKESRELDPDPAAIHSIFIRGNSGCWLQINDQLFISVS